MFRINRDKPHDMDTNVVFANNQAAIDAIRKTGAKQMFVIPWCGLGQLADGYVGFLPQVMVGQEQPHGHKPMTVIHRPQAKCCISLKILLIIRVY